ncbi:MAG: C40 family peptidase [Ignavibacteriales bacterium]
MNTRRFLLTVAFAVAIAGSSRTAGAAPASTVLKNGSRGPAVVSLQEVLAGKGYYAGKADGVFGARTKAAVIAFQKDAGLAPDGIAGPRTLEALRGPAEPSRGLPSAAISRLIETAKGFLGTRYVWGGTTPRGFDCSGFVYHVLNLCGIEIPRALEDQFTQGAAVPRKDLRPGDLVFFSTYKPGPSHVGIYLGDGTFIHASSARKQVTTTPIDKSYYVKNWVGARRLAPS